MIISVKIADETYEKYGRQNTKNPREAVERVLETYADIGSQKALIVMGEQLARLQKLAGQLDSPEQLVEKVEKLSSVQIGGLIMPLSESQQKCIKDMAAHQGMTPSEYAVREIQKAVRNALGV